MPVAMSLHSHPVTQSMKTISWTPASVNAATTTELTLTVPGVKPGDLVSVFPPGYTAGVALVGARVTVKDVVRVSFMNATAGALTPPAGAYKVLWMR